MVKYAFMEYSTDTFFIEYYLKRYSSVICNKSLIIRLRAYTKWHNDVKKNKNCEIIASRQLFNHTSKNVSMVINYK